MSTPRRSSRLREKNEEKEAICQSLRSKRTTPGRRQEKRNVLASSSEEEEEKEGLSVGEQEDEEVDVSTLISPVTAQRKPNNFLKVHSSYNYDRGGIDTYERDFIDDSHMTTPTRQKREQRRKRKRLKSSGDEDNDSSDSSDSVGVRKTSHSAIKKKAVVDDSSSDNEGGNPAISRHHEDVSETNKDAVEVREGALGTVTVSGDSVEEELRIPEVFRKKRKKTVSLNMDSDEDSLGGEKGEKKEGPKEGGGGSGQKKRRLRRPESDEEVSIEEDQQAAVRESSSRASKLRKEKEKERQKRLRRLRASRGVKGTKGEESSSESEASENNEDMNSPDESELFVEETEDAVYVGPIVVEEREDVVFVGLFTPTKRPPPSAETILFPVEEEEGSSEEEESDWIVSSDDDEEEIEDLMEVLAQLRKPQPIKQPPMNYPFEVVEDQEEGDGAAEQEMQLSLHQVLKECREMGEEESEGEGKDEDVGREEEIQKEREREEGKGERERKDEQESRRKEAEKRSTAATKLKQLLPKLKDRLEDVDSRGYTPVMLAAELGDRESLRLLLEAGATVNCKDANLTTPLHLAALSGWVECVDVLISHGHVVDCRDTQGWPPLLYAHFQDHHECVLALMKAQPKQLSVLRDLLRRTLNDGPDIRRKTVKVVRSLLMSLAHHEAYYSVFNDFVGQNLSVLEEDGFSFMKHCMRLLSFENKQAWLKGKLQKLREYARSVSSWNEPGIVLCDLVRDDLLNIVQKRLINVCAAQCWLKPPYVSFHKEPGICTGPRREFWSCFCKDLANEGGRLFARCDEGQLSLQPCSIFSKYFSSDLPSDVVIKHKQLLRCVGSLLACAVFHGDTLNLSFSKPLLKQLAGLPLTHPDDLEYVDQVFYHTMTKGDFDISDLELSFTQTLSCPWSTSSQTVDVAIKEGGRTCLVSEENKDDYIKMVSKFKLETVVDKELDAFLSGFWEVIPQKCLHVFTPDELSLLISGVPTIDVKDWSYNTHYRGLNRSDDIVIWFWKLVDSLKEEEKALLLKFATGSPRAPAGGFASLQGLGGPNKFTIVSAPGLDKIPQASTCFNMLKLSDYSCEQELRNKILIAIRYGCEGFAFS